MFKWWRIYQEEADDGTTGAGGGATTTTTTTPADGAAAPADGSAAAAPAGGEKKVDGAPKVDPMVAAIDAGLGYEPGKDGKKDAPAAGTTKAPVGETPEAKDAREKKEAEEKAIKERDEKAAAGDPEAIKAKAAADAKAKIEAAKPKDLKTLELKPEEKAAMKAATAARYNEVLAIAKSERAAREAAEAKIGPLAQSRDAILGVLKETNTSDEDLVQLLEFNRLTKTGRPEDLNAALAIVNAQRGNLMKALGKKGDDYDPLNEPGNADLKKKVEDQSITEDVALELAASRRAAALTRAGEAKGEQARQAQEQINQAHAKGLAAVEGWCAQVARTDIDYNAKETILLPKIDQIVATYPPHLWLPTIKQAYELIVVQKAPAQPPAGGGNQPLRPSGAKPGNAAPTSMAEAIDQGLGYVKT